MKRKRLITCMTGTRADYPRVKSVLEEISNRPDLELKLIVTGLHLVKEFGYTVREIEKDGFEIAERIPMYTGDDSPYGMAKAAARCADGIADAMKACSKDANVSLAGAKVFWKENKREKAKKWLEKAIELDKGLGDAWAYLYVFESEEEFE